ncbi:T9SS type A sorting domain-containing protein [Flavobacterium sp.]|uniref:T9SS type A sorting domain-containing protein n=1 Tax=Flavobacterium sp. TaxID=239 RepID=UPI0037C1B474
MRTIKKFTFLLLLFISSFTYAQTGVLVTYYDGNSQGFNIESSGKLYFDSDNLNVKLNSTTTTPTTIPVTIIRKITFSTTLSTTLFAENKKNLILYPNPNSDIFRIKSDVTEKMKINIYSLQGQLVHQGNYESDEAINVSYLPSGLYLVQVNDLTIKFSKK